MTGRNASVSVECAVAGDRRARAVDLHLWCVALAIVVLVPMSGLRAQEVTVGSKKFTESVILGELLAHLARDTGADATHRKELGGTRVLWSALLRGDIDAYVEYTGTLREEPRPPSG